jgi:hypothetical protein
MRGREARGFGCSPVVLANEHDGGRTNVFVVCSVGN